MANFRMPITDQNAVNQAQQQAEAQRRHNVQSIAKQGAGQTPSAIQTLGAQAGTQQAQAQTQAQTQGAQQVQQQAEIQNQQAQQNQQQQNLATQQASQQKQIDRKAQLQQLDQGLSNELLDATMDMSQKKADQAFANERQMVDWMATKAQSAEELNNWSQEINQLQQEKMQILDNTFQLAKQAIEFEYRSADGKRRRELSDQLSSITRAHEEAQRKAQQKARKKGGMMPMAVGALKVGAGVAIATVPGGQAIGAGVAAGGAGDLVQGYGATQG